MRGMCAIRLVEPDTWNTGKEEGIRKKSLNRSPKPRAEGSIPSAPAKGNPLIKPISGFFLFSGGDERKGLTTYLTTYEAKKESGETV